MQHEKATVKKAVKTYNTKKYGEKKSISVNINLGAKSEFNDGDEVAILPIAEFNKISDIDIDEIDDLKNGIAEKDATITANNESIDKLNAELKDKLDIINDITSKLKSSEKTVKDFEFDISANDETIAELTSEIDDLKDTNKKLLLRLNELTDLISGKDSKIDELIVINKKHSDKITELTVEIAKYDIDDIDELKQFKNVAFKYQKQVMEYMMLVNYKDKEISAYKNQGLIKHFINSITGKDATVDISDEKPTLKLIDESGNTIADPDDDNIIDAIATPDDDNVDADINESNKVNVNKSGDDDMILI